MNLHGIASSVISAVNPMQYATLKQSTGYTTGADGSRTPTYTTFTNVSVQVQELTADDLRHADSLNLQGNRKTFYLNGNWNGIIRQDRKGGDLLILGSDTYLVASVVEQWPDWTKFIGVLQDGS